MKKSTIIIFFVIFALSGCFKSSDEKKEVIDTESVEKIILDNNAGADNLSNMSEDGSVILNADIPENDGDGGDIILKNK